MPKITLTPGTSYRYTGTEGVYSVILGELVAGGDVPVGGSGGDPSAAYLVYSLTESLTNDKLLQVDYPLAKVEASEAYTISAPGAITKASPVFQNQAIFENNVQMYQTLNVTGSLNLSSTGNFLLTHTGSGAGVGNLTIASTDGTVKVEGTTFSGNNVGILGNLTVDGTSTLTGDAVFAGSVSSGRGYGDTGVTLGSTGNIQANGTLTVDGASTLTGNVTMGGDLTVNGGDITIADTAIIKDSGGHQRIKFTNTGDLEFGNALGLTALVITGSSTGVSVVGPLSIGGNLIRGGGSVATALSITGSNVGVGGSLRSLGAVTVGDGYSGTGITLQAGGAIQTKGTLAVDSTSTLAGNVTIGGGFGSAGVTISDSGNIQADGSLAVGGGYGSAGVTISDTGNIQANGTLTVDGASQLTGNVTVTGTSTLTGQVAIGGGYGSTGVTIQDTGNILVAGTLTVDQTSQLTGNVTVTGTSTLAGQVTVGGGYGLTGVTISDTGNIQANGTLTVDGNVTFGANIIADADENKSIFAAVSTQTVTIGGSSGGGVSVPGVLTVGSTANLNGSITNIGNATSDILNVAGTSVNFTSANAILKIGSNIGATTGRGIHIGQVANADGDGITWEQAGSNNYWSAFHDTDDNLQFAYNGADKGFIQDTVTTAGGEQMNDFTGQHRVSPLSSDLLNQSNVGLIVVSAGTYDSTQNVEDERDNISINESLPVVKLSSLRDQKSVIGVISSFEDSNDSIRTYASGIFVSVVHKKSTDDNRLIINSLGEGAIWITNINGNLENGDYITTCEIPGYGMKQDTDTLKNYTVAKITCDCSFDLNSSIYRCEEFQWNGQSYRKAFVGCTYHCG